MDIAEFLLARIAEDEALARDIPAGWVAPYDEGLRWHGDDMLVVHPTRVLAECEAKRRIVQGMQPFGAIDDINAAEILGLLALPYADHDDYLPEWSPHATR